MVLIDKAKLLNTIATEVHYDPEHSLEMYAKMLSLINDAPDGVVRCKDCFICETRQTANYLPFLYCELHDCSVLGDFYCSWAERREDGETN